MEEIFKAYDIRGRYPEEINEALAIKIGRAAHQFFHHPNILVGYDHRMSSPGLKDALIRGITELGTSVIDIGLVTTPMAYFASAHLQSPLVMITASHNPPTDNGMKFCLPNAVPVGLGTGLEIIKQYSNEEGGSFGSSSHGEVTPHFIQDEFFNFLRTQFSVREKYRVAIDPGGGAGAIDIPFWKSIPQIDVVSLLNTEFGKTSHEANPTKPETLVELGKEVIATNAHLGIAYDGDADRIGILDEHGTPIRADHLTALIASYLLEKSPHLHIGADIRSTRGVENLVNSRGGIFSYTPVGHAKIKLLMREHGIDFAGELSNHFYFSKAYIAEMGPLPALIILEVIEKFQKPLSTLVAELPRYFHSGEINFHTTHVKEILEKAQEKYSHGKLSTLDGVRIDYPDWWFSLRGSNTEPLLRLNLEADTDLLRREKLAELTSMISSFDPLSP